MVTTKPGTCTQSLLPRWSAPGENVRDNPQNMMQVLTYSLDVPSCWCISRLLREWP